jgi:hypothetical protein
MNSGTTIFAQLIHYPPFCAHCRAEHTSRSADQAPPVLARRGQTDATRGAGDTHTDHHARRIGSHTPGIARCDGVFPPITKR